MIDAMIRIKQAYRGRGGTCGARRVGGLAGAEAGAAEDRRAKPAAVAAKVYLTPTCGCCSKWVDHM